MHSLLRHSLRSSRFPVQRQTRHFHPTRPSPFVHEVLAASSSFLHGVHTLTGLPWVLSLPLSAVIVRMSIGLPLQIYTKTRARREQDMSPLLLSWFEHDRRAIMQDALDRRPPMTPLQVAIEQRKRMRERRRLLRKRWNVPSYYPYVNFLSIPVWIAVMDSLRQMSGISQGLIMYLTNILTRLPAETVAFLAGPDLKLAMPPETTSLALEASMASEGALWFQNLLAGDPTGVLPALLTLSVIMNVRTGWKAPKFEDLDKLPSGESAKQFSLKLLRLFIQVLAVYIGASAYVLQMPTALMLYWITSSNVATLQTYFLQKHMFLKPPLKPRRRVYIDFQTPDGRRP